MISALLSEFPNKEMFTKRCVLTGIDGTIRQASRKNDQSWRGGRQTDAIATGKLCTPIAATAWQHGDENRQPAVCSIHMR